MPATEAFDKLVEVLRARFPFGDAVPIDWEGIRATYRPEFEAAEQSGDRVDFWVALNHFLVAIHDWQYFAVWPGPDYFWPKMLGATGVHVEVTDDEEVVAVKIDPGLAGEQAGILPGAEILTWDAKPAIQAV